MMYQSCYIFSTEIVFNDGAIVLKTQWNKMHCVALGVPDVNHNVGAPSIFKFIYLKLLQHAPLQYSFDRHLKKLYL